MQYQQYHQPPGGPPGAGNPPGGAGAPPMPGAGHGARPYQPRYASAVTGAPHGGGPGQHGPRMPQHLVNNIRGIPPQAPLFNPAAAQQQSGHPQNIVYTLPLHTGQQPTILIGNPGNVGAVSSVHQTLNYPLCAQNVFEFSKLASESSGFGPESRGKTA